MKLYAEYVKERENKECVYDDNCFIVYKIYDCSISIIDIYSRPELRGSGEMRKFVKNFLVNMKEIGIKMAYGYTDESTNNWKKSEKLMLKFGFKKLGKVDKNYNNYVLDLQELL